MGSNNDGFYADGKQHMKVAVPLGDTGQGSKASRQKPSVTNESFDYGRASSMRRFKRDAAVVTVGRKR